ncbi:DUF86 domain-containing protein [Sphingobacteriales bacterium UPWRP_1]|nr:hypothetical protein BVG80_08550 [Sphingobacteriales bacterium TSM_CSM]PSJ78477.1 DUF86 domain-containing protein [Sphingobacteriales bacterium UPWRP_1]
MKDRSGNKARLLHIQEALQFIFRFVENKSENEFREDLILRFAIERQIEIIGEAVSRIDTELLALQPQIPWRSIVGMRNILSHEYFAVQPQLLWNVIKNDMPGLATAVKQLLNHLQDTNNHGE